MSFETFKASVYSLLDEIAGQPQDMHVLQERLREALSEMRAMGQPLPEDLVELEAWLEEDLAARGTRRRPPPLPQRYRRRAHARGRGHPADRQHPIPHTDLDED